MYLVVDGLVILAQLVNYHVDGKNNSKENHFVLKASEYQILSNKQMKVDDHLRFLRAIRQIPHGLLLHCLSLNTVNMFWGSHHRGRVGCQLDSCSTSGTKTEDVTRLPKGLQSTIRGALDQIASFTPIA